ncbi:MAG: GNAT family N-acetyltransferase [Oscillospiraceae bacterium]|nr:GNAT family N-acetyltransferase [Oscillospiraceae bacterium]
MQIPYLNILLRDMEEKDIADEIRWHTIETEWALWDGPWEMEEVLATFDPEKHRREELEWLAKPKPDHRLSLELDADGVHIGSVNAYCLDDNLEWKPLELGADHKAQHWAVGIEICESAYWSHGWGTRALTGYIHYHLKEGYTDLYTQTWSGNLRMIALAQKLGFRECLRRPGLRQVRGGTYDGLTFKLDREAFERHRAKLERESLELYIPKIEDMAFRREMMETPTTMAYNAGWNVSYSGYHPDTGCIDFPRSEWAVTHARLTGNMPHSFYAYLRERSSGAFMGEVNFQASSDGPWAEIGVVLHAPYKGRGYGRAALELLVETAFVDCGVPALRNTFEPERSAALAIHRAVGFREVGCGSMNRFGKSQELLVLELTREDYLRQREMQV